MSNRYAGQLFVTTHEDKVFIENRMTGQWFEVQADWMGGITMMRLTGPPTHLVIPAQENQPPYEAPTWGTVRRTDTYARVNDEAQAITMTTIKKNMDRLLGLPYHQNVTPGACLGIERSKLPEMVGEVFIEPAAAPCRWCKGTKEYVSPVTGAKSPCGECQ